MLKQDVGVKTLGISVAEEMRVLFGMFATGGLTCRVSIKRFKVGREKHQCVVDCAAVTHRRWPPGGSRATGEVLMTRLP